MADRALCLVSCFGDTGKGIGVDGGFVVGFLCLERGGNEVGVLVVWGQARGVRGDGMGCRETGRRTRLEGRRQEDEGREKG